MSHFTAFERLDRNTRRVGEIAAVLVRYGVADWLRKVPAPRMKEWLRADEGQDIAGLSRPVRIRLALTELGTTFIKLGQMLSMRPDLVGQELARELTRLQADTPPDPPGAAETLVERELGRPPHALFASFDTAPFASGSIAQVHHAVLQTGEEVVVKVQRAGIDKRIEADLGILADLAGLAEKHVSELKPYHPVALVRQLAKTLREELDFSRERRNLDEFRRNFPEDDIYFPAPYLALSTRRVLTMERLEGVPVSQVAELRGLDIDLDAFARRGATMYLQMVFRDSFYHADPHPGNLLVLPGEILGVLDCGMVQRLNEGVRETLEDMLAAAARGDAEALTDAVRHLATTPPTGPREELASDVTDFLAEYVGQPIGEVSLSAALSGITEIIYRHHIFLPPSVSMLLRTLIELEGTAKLLNPSFSLLEIISPYYRRTVGHGLSPGRFLVKLQRGSREWDRLLQALPRDLNDVLERLRAGTLSVHLDHRRLDPVVNRLVLGLLTASAFLGSSLLWSMKAAPLISGVSLAGAIGYTFSLVLGVMLFRRIRRSELPGSGQR
jgi:ubiquinone biosynthesis protein